MGERLHFLDWLRTLLVAAVVYAHLTFCGLDRLSDWTIDNHAYDMVDPNSFRGRWVSLCRPWTIPVLFWVSGASLAVKFNGEPRPFFKAIFKLFVLSVCGVACNAAMWFLSPRDENCAIGRAAEPECKGKGILFDFTEDPYSGYIEPYFNQMWYTCILLIIMPASWPMLKVVSGKGGHIALALQFVGFTVLYLIFASVVGDESPHPGVLKLQLIVCEGAFLGLAFLAGSKPANIPLRTVHYACAAVAVIQIGASPLSCGRTHCLPKENDITPGFLLYMLVGVLRWFQLGFIMTRPRKCPANDQVRPCCSNVWPAVMILFCFVMPSTNWYMAGVLPYAYYERTLDRVMYSSATIGWMFVIDRCSREMKHCMPLPTFLHYGSLVLYVGQIVYLTIYMQILPNEICTIEVVWFLAAGTATAIGFMLARLFPQSLPNSRENDDNAAELTQSIHVGCADVLLNADTLAADRPEVQKQMISEPNS